MRTNRMSRAAFPLIVLLLAASCSRHERAADADATAESAPAMGESAAVAAGVEVAPQNREAPMLQGPGVDPSQVASDVATQVDPQRRFIRTAQAQFQVKDVYRTALAIEDEVASQGGFVVDNEISSQVQRVLSRPLAPGKRLELTDTACRAS